jgi:hypothetical protein
VGSPEQGKWLSAVVGGHFRYYAVPMNGPALRLFRFHVGWLWYPHAVAAQPEYPPELGPDEPVDCSLVACNPHPSSVSAAPPRRYHLRQEPDADNPLVRICGRVVGDHDSYSDNMRVRVCLEPSQGRT